MKIVSPAFATQCTLIAALAVTLMIAGCGGMPESARQPATNASAGSGAAANRLLSDTGFGPLAATRALCPPPSLDERIAA